jgi:hypothetical protein
MSPCGLCGLKLALCHLHLNFLSEENGEPTVPVHRIVTGSKQIDIPNVLGLEEGPSESE